MRKVFLYFVLICLYAFGSPSLAQVKIDNYIDLTGSTQNDRTITLQSLPVEGDAAASADYILKNHAHFVSSSGLNQYILNISPAPAAYSPGLSIHMIVPSTNTGPVNINLNGLGAIPVLKNTTSQLDSADFIQGNAIVLVFDGTSFHVTSPLPVSCPDGFVAVNEKYCIETDEHSSTTYFNAVVYCHDNNARLCTWGEWYYACSNSTTLGLQNMTNNYEWADDNANEPQFARVSGHGGSCQTISAVHGNNNNYWFRCCYSR